MIDYVTQRTESMMGLFYLLTIYCSVRALDDGPGAGMPRPILACAAGMACKESMVTAPVIVGTVRLRVRLAPGAAEDSPAPVVRRPGLDVAVAGGAHGVRTENDRRASTPT